MDIAIRKMQPAEADAVAALWAAGWQDAHAAIVPPGLLRLRTPDSFRERQARRADATWVAARDGVLGLFMLDGDELEQFYVAGAARGTA